MAKWLAQSVLISGTKSMCRRVTGSVLGSILLNIDDLGDSVDRTLTKLANNAKLGKVADTPEGCTAIQRDLNRLKELPNRKLMKFSKERKILWLVWNSPMLGQTVWKMALQRKIWLCW